eukprot:366434-Chlamydomonas_euryale.AAC.3
MGRCTTHVASAPPPHAFQTLSVGLHLRVAGPSVWGACVGLHLRWTSHSTQRSMHPERNTPTHPLTFTFPLTPTHSHTSPLA